jgi:hypothetical protein
VGRGPAAAAVTALVTAPAGQDPLAAAPADFASVMGYTPVPTPMADGTVRLAKPAGSCSVPGGGAPFGFEQACKVHDYGYDLLRYAHATGQQLTAEARRQLDATFGRSLHAHCQATRHGLAGAGCNLAAEAFITGVAVNSWRQHHGNPARESLPGWALGLAVPVLAAPFLAMTLYLWHITAMIALYGLVPSAVALPHPGKLGASLARRPTNGSHAPRPTTADPSGVP